MTKISVAPCDVETLAEKPENNLYSKFTEMINNFKPRKDVGLRTTWPQGEVKPGQETRYSKWLEEKSHDIPALEAELLECVKYNLVRKFKILSKFLCDIGLGINLDIACTGSCLLSAVGSNNAEISALIIELADRELLMQQVTKTPLYSGCTALHMATANNMFETVEGMMNKLDEEDRLVMLNTHIQGKAFLKSMDLPSLPLHLACWTGNIQIYDVLIAYGAAADAPDIGGGNTVFHVLVKLSNTKPDLAKTMFEAVLNSPETHKWFCKKMHIDYNFWTKQDKVELKKYLLTIENNDGYTPLTLAAKLGIQTILDFILNIEGVYRTTVWHFGSQCFASYNLAEIDPFITGKFHTGRANVLELLLYRPLSQHAVFCFDVPVIKQFVKEKFQNLSCVFSFWFLVHFLLILCCYNIFVTIVYEIEIHTANNTEWNTSSSRNMSVHNIVPMDIIGQSKFLQLQLGFMGTVICTNMLMEIIDNGTTICMLLARITRKWHGLIYKVPFYVAIKADEFRWILLAFNIFELYAMFKLVFCSTVSMLHVPAFACGCYFFMFFLQGSQRTGYFNTMLHIIISGDLLSFASLFLIMLTGFGAGMMVISYKNSYNLLGFKTFYSADYSMFKYMTGFGNIADIDNMNNVMATFLFVAFVCFTMILLMNLLIAAMSETYSNLAAHRDKICTRNMASATLVVERWTMNLVAKYRYKNVLQYEEQSGTWRYVIETSDPPTCL